MRFSEIEKKALFAAIHAISYPVFLFGSRTDDLKKGGDIDLLILTRGLSSDARLDLSIQVTTSFRSICDEKIDVIVFDEDALTPENQAFLNSIERIRLFPEKP